MNMSLWGVVRWISCLTSCSGVLPQLLRLSRPILKEQRTYLDAVD